MCARACGVVRVKAETKPWAAVDDKEDVALQGRVQYEMGIESLLATLTSATRPQTGASGGAGCLRPTTRSRTQRTADDQAAVYDAPDAPIVKTRHFKPWEF